MQRLSSRAQTVPRSVMLCAFASPCHSICFSPRDVVTSQRKPHGGQTIKLTRVLVVGSLLRCLGFRTAAVKKSFLPSQLFGHPCCNGQSDHVRHVLPSMSCLANPGRTQDRTCALQAASAASSLLRGWMGGGPAWGLVYLIFLGFKSEAKQANVTSARPTT